MSVGFLNIIINDVLKPSAHSINGNIGHIWVIFYIFGLKYVLDTISQLVCLFPREVNEVEEVVKKLMQICSVLLVCNLFFRGGGGAK